MPRRALALLVVLSGVLSTACSAKKWPEPMGGPFAVPTPGAADSPTSAQEVTVLRHSDPVMIRRPGANSAFPLAFYDKYQRLSAGSVVLTGPGGRAEVLWGAEGTNAVLYGTCACEVGDRTRGEAALTFLAVSRSRLILAPGDRAQLLGGAVLRGSADETTGPIHLEWIARDLLRLHNQSKINLSVAYRDSDLEIAGGQVVDLPVLSVGTNPFPRDPELVFLSNGGVRVAAGGAVQRVGTDATPGLRMRARGAGTLQGQGVVLDMNPGDEAVFAPLIDPAAVGVPTAGGTP